jgi:hypothetical protein
MKVITSSFFNMQRANTAPKNNLTQGISHSISMAELFSEGESMIYTKDGKLMPKPNNGPYPEGFVKFKNTSCAWKKNLRVQVFHRDGFKCVKCGSTEDLTLDHIYPKSKGGKRTFENLQTMCKACNFEKGDKVI